MATAFHLSRSLSRARVSRGLFRAIATQSSKAKAPQAVIQATNVGVQALSRDAATRPDKELRRVRRLSVAASSSSAPDEDLLVDMDALKALASQRPTPLRLKDMHYYASEGGAQRLRNAQYLHKEIPIRMAQRAMDLLTLPHGLDKYVQNVAHVYLKYIDLIQQMSPPTTMEEEDAFTDLLETVLLDRHTIPNSISQAIDSWMSNCKQVPPQQELQEMENALYRFFTARVGLRFLTEHHIFSNPLRKHPDALQEEESSHDFLGCIQTDCDPVHEIQKAIDCVTQQTTECYGVCPTIELVASGNDDGGFTYVPHHLHYMVSELLKNSCRATVDRYHYGQQQDDDGTDSCMPPIKVVVVQGAEDVSIKVADSGGGVPRSTMERIWKFAHSNAKEREAEFEFGKDTVLGKIRGFGLPLARIYARYFGGELTLRSMEGHGVDAYLYLPRLGYNCENLPASVVQSPGEGDSTPQSNSLQTMTTPIVQRTENAMASGTATVLTSRPPSTLDTLQQSAAL